MDILQKILSATKNITQSELEHLEYMQDQINILYESIKINQDILGKSVLKGET